MSRCQTKPNSFVDQNRQSARTDRLERIAQANYVAKDINTTGLTSAQIDTAVFGSSSNGQSFDGLTITDKTNNLLLVRLSGKWCKATMTLIP